MKILTADELRAWDQYTIDHEPIASIDLMERAAVSCVNWLDTNGYGENQFAIFCGKGNNGGDGLAIARLLAAKKNKVRIFKNFILLIIFFIEVLVIFNLKHFNIIIKSVNKG